MMNHHYNISRTDIEKKIMKIHLISIIEFRRVLCIKELTDITKIIVITKVALIAIQIRI